MAIVSPVKTVWIILGLALSFALPVSSHAGPLATDSPLTLQIDSLALKVQIRSAQLLKNRLENGYIPGSVELFLKGDLPDSQIRYIVQTGEGFSEEVALRRAQLFIQFLEKATDRYQIRTSPQRVYDPATQSEVSVSKFVDGLDRERELKSGEYDGLVRQFVGTLDRIFRNGIYQHPNPASIALGFTRGTRASQSPQKPQKYEDSEEEDDIRSLEASGAPASSGVSAY